MNELKPEDVMRALECCTSKGRCDYNNCPYVDRYHCNDVVMQDALALLREKDAEIERLREKSKEWRDCADKLFEEVETARAEAITEFVERVKEVAIYADVSDGWGSKQFWEKAVKVFDIDKIAKELKGEKE